MAAPNEQANLAVTRGDIREVARENIDKGLSSWEMVHWYFGAHGTMSRPQTMEEYVNYLDRIYLKQPVRDPMLLLPSMDVVIRNTRIQQDAFPIGVSTEPVEVDDLHSVFCFTLRSSRPMVFLGNRDSRTGWLETVGHTIHSQFSAYPGEQLEVIVIGEQNELARIKQYLVGKNERDAAYPYDALPPDLWGYFQKLPSLRTAHVAPTKSIVLVTDDGAHDEELALMMDLGKKQNDIHVIVFSDRLSVDQLPGYAVVLGCEGIKHDGIAEPVTRSQAVLLNDSDFPRYWRIAPTRHLHPQSE